MNQDQLMKALNDYQPKYAVEQEAIEFMKNNPTSGPTLKNNLALLNPTTTHNVECWNVIAWFAKTTN